MNEGFPSRGEKVPIANQENVNEVVPLKVPQAPQVPKVEGDMSNVELRADFRALTNS